MWQDILIWLPLPFISYLALDLLTKCYGRLEEHVPLNLAVAKDHSNARVGYTSADRYATRVFLYKGSHSRVSHSGWRDSWFGRLW
jgi:hypothetical protein